MIQCLVEKYILCIYLMENKLSKFYFMNFQLLYQEDNYLRFINSQIFKSLNF